MVLGVVILLLFLIGAFLVYYFSPDENKVLDFIRSNPDKSAVLIYRNDTLVAAQNVNSMMPLASTVKIIVAIEYADQSAQGLINPDELVLLKDLDKYYVPGTDGGAHSGRLKALSKKGMTGQVPVREIVKGMIEYSSNANTEWLQDKLGLKNINNRLKSLGAILK